MVFREIIAVHTEKHIMKPINTVCEQNAELQSIKAGGIYTYHWALNC
jgi:hypothetical protein